MDGVGGDPEGTVAGQVRRRRLALGLSNSELAARAGISRAMLSKIEHRRTSCSLTTLARLAAALEVPTAALLGEVEPAHRVVFTPAGRRRRGPARTGCSARPARRPAASRRTW